ncbi:YolD-like family protein [Paenibacillus endoradicis]|uniref:YolD-like family protein n=1 Tax=Paenibacillus endoradicis TaxID=2972487 RepID=UPI0021593E56|nr:YolD-like family protein [Paenibacillus endoradicis]MCR8659383.1 YolD-like family protein [Paenibacillus endoradicis]
MIPKPKKSSSKPKRPTRDEYELEELGERLVEAKDEKSDVRLEVWNSEEDVIGCIVGLDSRTKLVHVSCNGDIIKVPFLDIMKVSNSS